MIDDIDRAWRFVHGVECGRKQSLTGTCRLTRDHAGRTIHGVTERDHPRLWANDHVPTIDEARHVFETDYWDRLGCGDFPYELAVALVDFGWHAGPFRAASTLQKALSVARDGIIGPETRGAVAKHGNPIQLAAELTSMRRSHLLDLIEKNETRGDPDKLAQYRRGWENRLLALLEEVRGGRPQDPSTSIGGHPAKPSGVA